jgi:hypothetical protein
MKIGTLFRHLKQGDLNLLLSCWNMIEPNKTSLERPEDFQGENAFQRLFLGNLVPVQPQTSPSFFLFSSITATATFRTQTRRENRFGRFLKPKSGMSF